MAERNIKKFLIPICLVAVFSLAAFAFVSAADEPPPPPPPRVCGDSIVQSPNDDGQFEKCDDGGVETARCSAFCGQKMLGWAWASTFGWLSSNCENHGDWPCVFLNYENYEYFTQLTAGDGENVDITINGSPLTLEDRGELIGYAWSDNAGWVCFGATCNEAPPYDQPQALVVSDSDMEGLIEIPDPDPDNPQVIGWAKILLLGDDGWLSLNCANHSNCDPGNLSNYQVRVSEENFNGKNRLTLSGWAWNNKAGWLRFNPEVTISSWLQTKYGDIYAQGGFRASQQPPGFSATYRILAGGQISNFISAKQALDEAFWLGENIPITFPRPETRYSNVLGRLDIDSLLCALPVGTTDCLNQYGQTVVNLDHDANNLESLAELQSLGGKIYYTQNDLTLDNLIAFKNGSNFASGAGTIIIDGDLTINADIKYDDPLNPLNSFKNLASVAWIVRGDLKIAPDVENLAGNFIVIGDGTSCEVEPAGCGQIHTCYNSADCGRRLTVSGLMLAREFYFDRTYVSEEEAVPKGSEIIIYDGRLLANTPPGLGDFAKALPVWRGGAAQ